ncbi:MAG: nitrate reductase cytochrome c-type subunit [Methyloligellaceae bacterium]
MTGFNRAAGALGLIAAASCLIWTSSAFGQDQTATLRGADIATQPGAPAMPKVENTDLRRVRNYPEQPPTIPHKIRGYQVDLNTNKCLTCHSRAAIEQSQAPMVSVTHFMDRDGQVRAVVSPRRYFCLQCHVPQTDARPLVGNTFKDVDTVIKGGKGG